MGGKVFYKKGLNFNCQKCLYCCSAEPGYVFLSLEDISRLSSFFKLDKDEFLNIYTRKIDYGRYYLFSLKERSNYDCIFLTKEGCSVYEAKPTQCSTYPFWKNIVESKENWDSEALSCPGINKGRLVKKEEIEKYLEKNNDNIPYMEFKK